PDVEMGHGEHVADLATIAPVTPAGRPRCVAVLPFEDTSSDGGGDNERHVFARGLAEALSAALAGLPGFEVIPPAVAQIAPGEDPRRRVRELGASLMVRGTVQRTRDRLRVNYLVLSPMEEVQISGDRIDGTLAGL